MFSVINGIVFLLVGYAVGYNSPRLGWLWGLIIVSPVALLLGVSVMFAGNEDVFIQKDLQILIAALAGACLGAFWGSRKKKSKLSNKP